MKRGLINRKAQVFGLSFGVIFSIIIIIFILVVAGIAINHFIDLKRCAQIGLFIEDLQNDIDKVWNSQSSSFSENYNLPGNLDYVCFANLSKNVKGGNLESRVYSDISLYKESNANMFFYPRENACDMPYINMKHINVENIIKSKNKNPACFQVAEGKIVINIEKGFNEALVRLK